MLRLLTLATVLSTPSTALAHIGAHSEAGHFFTDPLHLGLTIGALAAAGIIVGYLVRK